MQAVNTKYKKEEKKIPNLRFPRFEGEWANKKFGELGYFLGGGTPSTKIQDFWNGDIPWISSSDLSEDNIYSINYHRYISQEAVDRSATKIVPPKSILIVSRVGVGKIAVNEVELCTSQDYSNLVLSNSYYLFVAYLIKIKTKRLLEFNQGTSIKGFVKSDLESLKIHIPSLPEQQKIASFLSAVDQKIQQLTRKKEQLELYKKGVMQKIFSQEIRFKDENGNDFPDWEEKRLGDIFKIKYGRDYKHLNKGNIPVLGTGGVMTYVDKFLYDKPSVLIGRKGSISSPQFIEVPFWTVDTSFYTEIGEDYDPYFVFQVVSNVNWMKYNEATGVPSLNTVGINSVKVFVPKSLDEQKNITKFSRNIDNKIKSIKTQISQTQKFKKGLLQQMFV